LTETAHRFTDRVRRLIPLNDWSLISCSWDRARDGEANLKHLNKSDMIEIGRFTGHNDSVNAIVLYETILISGSSDETIRLWNTTTYTEIRTPLLANNSVEFLKIISKDLLVSGLDNGQILFWNITKLLMNLNDDGPKTLNTSHRDKVTELEYLNDTNILISSSYDKNIFVINMTDPYNDSLITRLINHTNKVATLLYIQSKSILVSASWDETIKLWNTSDWTVLKTLEGHTDPVFSLLYDDQKDVLLSGSWDTTIRVWNITTGVCLETINTQLIIWSMMFL
jgi:WD40 repeat protein